MPKSSCSALIALALLTVACGCAQLPPSDPVAQLRQGEMSWSALQSILPDLRKLAPGDDLSSLENWRRSYWLESADGRRSPFVIMPGWVSSLSGRAHGGLFSMFGQLFAQSGRTINGRHVFGYVWGDLNLVPQFLIITQATTIDRAEYEELNALETRGIGLFPGTSKTVYFRDLRVVETRPLPFHGPHDREVEEFQREPAEGGLAVAGFTEEAFRKTEKRLLQIAEGTDLWGVFSELGALFITVDYGENYSLLMDGFLNRGGVRTRSISTDHAIYRLRPFGYVEGDREITKLIAVFKNGRLEKVVPHSGLEDWRGYISE